MIRSPFQRQTPIGRTLRGDLRLPEGAPPRSAVLIVHGFKGFKDWGFFPHVAERLAAQGHAAVSFNLSGSGVTDGEEVTDLEAFAANTFTGELDELAWMAELVREGDLLPRRPRRLGLFGHSRGGGDAILHTAANGGVDALATWAAVSTFDRWSEETRREWRERGRVFVLNSRTGRQLPLNIGLLEDFERNRDRLDILTHAPKVSAPWLIVHGVDDLTVSVDEARALARAAPAARMHLIEGAGHTFEVTHPLKGRSSPQLAEALDSTLSHFARWLLEDG